MTTAAAKSSGKSFAGNLGKLTSSAHDASASRFDQAEKIMKAATGTAGAALTGGGAPESVPAPAPAATPPAAAVPAPDPAVDPGRELQKNTFSMLRSDYDVLAEIHDRLLSVRVVATMNEVLRAGLHALNEMKPEDVATRIERLAKPNVRLRRRRASNG